MVSSLVLRLQEVSKDTDGGSSSDNALGGAHRGSGVLLVVGGRGGRAAGTRASTLGGRGRGGRATGLGAVGLGGVQSTAGLLDVGLAGLLVSGEADVLLVALLKEALADEGGHGLRVVLEAGGAAVGAADALVAERVLQSMS